MNYLKCKIMVAMLKFHPPMSVSVLQKQMQPYMEHFNLRLTKEMILFPEKISLVQSLEFLNDPGRLYLKGILYKDVIDIEQPSSDEITLFVRTGHIFVFSLNRPVWKIVDLYHYGQTLSEWINYSKTYNRLKALRSPFKRFIGNQV